MKESNYACLKSNQNEKAESSYACLNRKARIFQNPKREIKKTNMDMRENQPSTEGMNDDMTGLIDSSCCFWRGLLTASGGNRREEVGKLGYREEVQR